MKKFQSSKLILKDVGKVLFKIFLAVFISAGLTIIVLIGYSNPVIFTVLFIFFVSIWYNFFRRGGGGTLEHIVYKREKLTWRKTILNLILLVGIIFIVMGLGFFFTILIKYYNSDYKKTVRLILYGVSVIGGTIYGLIKKDSDFFEKIKIVGVCTGVASGIDGIFSNLPDFLEK